MTETEGMLNTRTGEYDFIGRSIPIFPKDAPSLHWERPFYRIDRMCCAFNDHGNNREYYFTSDWGANNLTSTLYQCS